MTMLKSRCDYIMYDGKEWVRHTIWGRIDQQFTSRRVGTKLYNIDSSFEDTIKTLTESNTHYIDVIVGEYRAIFIPKEG